MGEGRSPTFPNELQQSSFAFPVYLLKVLEAGAGLGWGWGGGLHVLHDAVTMTIAI